MTGPDSVLGAVIMNLSGFAAGSLIGAALSPEKGVSIISLGIAVAVLCNAIAIAVALGVNRGSQ